MEEEVLFKPVLGRKENVRYFETPDHQRPQCFRGRKRIKLCSRASSETHNALAMIAVVSHAAAINKDQQNQHR